jgi:hypothetical protein
MRIKILVMTVLAVCLLITTAYSSDIAGTWKGSQEFMGRAREVSFTFVTDKDDPTKFTGTSPGRQGGENQITDGKIDGDNISFNVKYTAETRELIIKYTGTVKDKEMTLNMEVDFSGMGGAPGGGGGGFGGPPPPLVLKKVE